MAYLILANGDVYKGERIGARGDAAGELVFTTGMTGYNETLTDPSYAGQIIVQTFPLIGNCGKISPDFEGKSAARGYVVREMCDFPSNFRSEGQLDRFLSDNGIPGICGVDTRQITRTIREFGVMDAVISDDAGAFDRMAGEAALRFAVGSVTCKSIHVCRPDSEPRFRVSLVDYGVKRSIITNLTARGCEVSVFPATSGADEILSGSPDGVVLSNGPGDPSENVFQYTQIRSMMGKVPVFGICLGHQLTALAAGGSTYKLIFGHRGGNQPVRETGSGRVYITSQNHGYAVDPTGLAGIGRMSFFNANDGSCEGMDYEDMDCFTVQFHPEACGGPRDTGFLFDRFISMMENRKG